MKRWIGLLLAGLLLSAGAVTAQGRSEFGTLMHEGRERSYYVYEPAAAPPDGGAPALLIVLHGGGGRGQGMVWLTRGGFNDLAERDGFIVVYPNGIDNNWNDGRDIRSSSAHRDNIDDVGFIDRLIDAMASRYSIDPARVFVTGISNGGIMAFRLACDLPDRFAGIAAVTANLPVDAVETCQPFTEIPVMILNGTADPLVPYDGGPIQIGRARRGDVLSTAETVAFWLDVNTCASEPVSTRVIDRDETDGVRARHEVYGGCSGRGAVELYALEGGGHTWPGGRQYLPVGVIGETSMDISAADVIWEFFATRVVA